MIQIVFSFWKLVLFFILFVVMSTVFGRVSDYKVLFNDFKESFTLSEYYVVYANGSSQDPTNEDPEAEIENLPKNVIITQVRNNE